MPGQNSRIPVPCGKCPECVKRRISQWSFRLLQEERVSSSAYFITFSYDGESLPRSRNGFPELRKRELQLFFKRLRKIHLSELQRNVGSVVSSRGRIKYFAVGEYGKERRRPHYHVLLFNAELELMFSQNDVLGLKATNFDGKLHVHCKQWYNEKTGKDLGHVTVGRVEGASVGYCFKYMSKAWKPMHKNDDRTPQFSLMSKGLGKSYCSDVMRRWHIADLDERMYCVVNDGTGKKISMPRYYKDRIYTEEERDRVATVQGQRAELLLGEKFWSQTAEELHDEIESHLNRFDKLKLDHERGLKL